MSEIACASSLISDELIGKTQVAMIEVAGMKGDTLSPDPQLDFCRCFGGMDKTGTEIALYPPGFSSLAMLLALHKSFWGSPSISIASSNV